MKMHDPRIRKDVNRNLIGKMVALKPPASEITGKVINQNFDCLTILWNDGDESYVHKDDVLISNMKGD